MPSRATPLLLQDVSRQHTPLHCLQVFNVFRDQKLSVDVVATSEVSISLTLDPAK